MEKTIIAIAEDWIYLKRILCNMNGISEIIETSVSCPGFKSRPQAWVFVVI